MGCHAYQNCGGCVFRELDFKTYQAKKEKQVKDFLEEKLGDLRSVWQRPIFLNDGSRRRAAFAFTVKKNKLVFGFNEIQSSQIVDIKNCLMLTDKINRILPDLIKFLETLCDIQVTKKIKAKKFETVRILSGDLQVLDAENGLDVVLETAECLELEHRVAICDFVNAHDELIRFSWRKKHVYQAEPILEKTQPFIKICDFDVFVAPGDFLQASKEGEQVLVKLVKEGLEGIKGKVADLFCGIGTFSYALATIDGVKVVASDVSDSLLKGFKKTLDKQMIHNIEICQKNLFLYPFTAEELAGFKAVVFDPPRAGAKAQVKELCQVSAEVRPSRIVAVSCNVETFSHDAQMLINAGYFLEKITLVDQFVYSNHSEVVAVFTNQK